MPFNFNKDEEVGDVEAPQTGSTKFAKIGMYIRNFEKGGPVTFQGVFEDEYENGVSTRLGLLEFKRQPLEKKVNLKEKVMCVIVLECERENGETYQIVKQCDNYLMENGQANEEGKKEMVNFFSTFQYPELLAAEGEGALDALGNADAPDRWVYGQVTFLDSGIPTEWSTRKYPGDFVIYPTEKAWREASEKFYTPAGEREEDTWISAELEDLVHEAANNAWAGSLDLLRETAIKVANETIPAIQIKELGIKDAELRQEVIDRAVGTPIEAEVLTEEEVPF